MLAWAPSMCSSANPSFDTCTLCCDAYSVAGYFKLARKYAAGKRGWEGVHTPVVGCGHSCMLVLPTHTCPHSVATTELP